MNQEKRDCNCYKCVEACSNGNPGWFAPGQAEKAAELMGMPFEDFKRKYLITDFWVDNDDDIDVLAPVKTVYGNPIESTGERVSFGYAFQKARCIFLNENSRCRIHAAKPKECRDAMPCENDNGGGREDVAMLWKKHYAAQEART